MNAETLRRTKFQTGETLFALKAPFGSRVVWRLPSSVAVLRYIIPAALLIASPCFAALHDEVDALIAAKVVGQPIAGAASDAEFLRRVWLDLDGGVPSAAEARTWLDDAAPDKRERLLEQLLSAPRYPERMAEAFHVMLMERRGDDAAWREWLVQAFQTNKPWDAMTREMLTPDFFDEKQRGAGFFMTRRLEKVGQQETDYPGLTRDVGRLFMGVDLQCCQCHTHLTVKDYKQQDFQGLFVAFGNLKLQPADEKHKTAWLSEGALASKAEFVSVLTDKKGVTGPRVPFGDEVEVPAGTGDEAWLVKPDRKTKELGTPRFSPLREIAQRLPAPANAFFARNIVNRVWWLLMGRGLIEPLDLLHNANPPSHPELLGLLEKEFVAHGCDLRWLMRELALTGVYQRAGTPADEAANATEAPDALYLTARERRLTTEQLLRAFLLATGEMERMKATAKADEKDDLGRYTFADFAKAFQAALANAPKEPELQPAPSLRSALFFRNSDHVQWALRPREGNLMDRVMRLGDAGAIAEELYLAVLTRRPNADETAAFSAWLEKQGADRAKATGDFAWALFSSSEWFVNH